MRNTLQELVGMILYLQFFGEHLSEFCSTRLIRNFIEEEF